MAVEPMTVSLPIPAPLTRGGMAIEAVAPAGLARGAADAELLYAWTKRGLDILVAVVLLIALAPLFLAIAVAIRLDSLGPIFYAGERIGRNGRRFTVYKFRSMGARADQTAHMSFVRDLLRDGTNCGVYKVPSDSRITRIGAFLRSSSFDELPQLWNVVRGEMSLVGPRPDVPYAVAEYRDWMNRRLAVPPGITGLWQVSGRSTLSLLEMYRLDLDYVSSASLLLDLRILFRTIPVVLSREGAR